MTTHDALLKEIEQVPEPLLPEILDFIRFLKSKLIRERLDITLASQPSLAREWSRPEEDAAWLDL